MPPVMVAPVALSDEARVAAPSRRGTGRAGGRIERTLKRGFELPAPGLSERSGDRRSGPARARAADGGGGLSGLLLGAAVAALGSVALALAGLARRRRDLGRTGAADTTPAMLGDRARRAAEDASVPGTAEKNGLVANGDLESVALREPESLPDLDRDHDPAELVQVPDDPGCRLPATASRRRFHQVVSRPPRHRRRAARPAARPIR